MNNEELMKSLGMSIPEQKNSKKIEQTRENMTEEGSTDKSNELNKKKEENIIEVGENENLFRALGMEIPENKKATTKPNVKSNSKTTKAGTKTEAKTLEKDKEKIVKVYGEEVMHINKGEKAEVEEIRLYLVETLGFREFQKEDTEMSIINDGNTQIIIPQIKFKPKG